MADSGVKKGAKRKKQPGNYKAASLLTQAQQQSEAIRLKEVEMCGAITYCETNKKSPGKAVAAGLIPASRRKSLARRLVERKASASAAASTGAEMPYAAVFPDPLEVNRENKYKTVSGR